ncbi:LRR receptor-like serine/threonine-protein kinase RCH1 isoform X2 [Camellia sinensis]|uniref:LRR receptor-like serine/threonine-protein kinase RCH1 isoform X2 n=1 Tax=Camellia sinensis TaxID=4442 RepID=UPI0010356668|nr:LRR receptor-like serine/threonine-protein kinase RCH1 isoform X2 [Camellia sinensis]
MMFTTMISLLIGDLKNLQSMDFQGNKLTGQIPDEIGNCVSLMLVFDEDVGQDKRLGIAKLKLIELEAKTPKEVEVRLFPSLDMLKIKDKKDRGTLTVKEQLAALEAEKMILEERKKLKAAGVIGIG